ncbi:isoprenyl transferase [bacterium]|nr:isoprenyl transferase [bacterium]
MDANLNRLKKELKDIGQIPAHVAIIMDGNGRWAQEKNLPLGEGHKEGVKTVQKIVRISGEIGVKVLTLYTFSKENWKRPPKEVTFLMKLLRSTVFKEIEELMENDVKLILSGDIEGLPVSQKKAMEYGIKKTKNNNGLVLNLALNYGGRTEIVNAIRTIVADFDENKISYKDINEELVSNYLYTKNLPDPDLIIRTGGELRLSNFLLWQSSYSELYISKKYWPDFNEEDFCNALLDFSRRERRFGGRKIER